VVTRMLGGWCQSIVPIRRLTAARAHRAPITPPRAVSRETVGEGGGGPLFGNATGALFPAFWRFVSDAILMQELN